MSLLVHEIIPTIKRKNSSCNKLMSMKVQWENERLGVSADHPDTVEAGQYETFNISIVF